MKRLGLCLAAVTAVLLCSFVRAGTWTPLTNQPSFNVSTLFLMMDGRVLAHDEYSANWWILTPDQFGSYRNGTWSRTGSTRWTRLYYGSGVFPDGRVIVFGGEYSNGGSWTNKTEIYNPATGTWTEISPPPGWGNIVGDASCVMTEDGRFFAGNAFDARTAFLDPDTLLWTAGPNLPNGRSNEETWIVLPDNTVLKWDCFGHPGSRKWVPTTNTWVSCGNTATDLVLPGSYETGAAILLPDARTFCIGGPPRTNFYIMPQNPGDPGTWQNGPSAQRIGGRDIGAEDAPAAMLPDGHVLMALGKVTTQGGSFEAPTYFHEFDGTNIVRITDPPSANKVPYAGHMLNLPTGEILFANGQPNCYLYTNGNPPQDAWRPTITNVASSLQAGGTYVLEGTQLNGVTNGSSYGDEAYTATNYPIIRLTNPASGQVYYCRSFDPSTFGVQTGARIVSANFTVPTNVPNGSYQLDVVASGIASQSVGVTVGVTESFFPSAYTVVRGVEIGSNDPAKLGTNDDVNVVAEQRFQVSPALANAEMVAAATVTGAIGGASLTVRLSAGSLPLSTSRQEIALRNWQSGLFEVVDARSPSSSEAEVSVSLNAAQIAKYFDGTGRIDASCRVFQQNPLSPGWRMQVDLLRVNIIR